MIFICKLVKIIYQIEARNVDGATPLCDACSKGNPIIVSLLLQHGAKVNPALNFTSPLHEAVLSGMYYVGFSHFYVAKNFGNSIKFAFSDLEALYKFKMYFFIFL